MIYYAKYGEAWTLRGFQLVDRSTNQYKTTPTLAAGDVKIEKDGGAAANLATLPSVAPAAGSSLDVPFSAAEMQCKQAVVRFVDAAGSEWNDDCIHVFTVGHPAAYSQFDPFSATVALSVASQSAVVTDVWSALQASHVVGGSMGEAITDLLTAAEAIQERTDNLPDAPAAEGSAMALTSSERSSTATALLDLADAIETGLTLRKALRLIAAAEAGKLSGAATATVTIRNAVADSKARITATVDSDGNRTAVTTDLT